MRSGEKTAPKPPKKQQMPIDFLTVFWYNNIDVGHP
jgi:hypothetical protein